MERNLRIRDFPQHKLYPAEDMRAFIVSRDLATINNWLKKRGKEPLGEKEVPRFGMIVDGAAVGFLELTDGSSCFLECFISNPDEDSDERDKAISNISRWLLGVAASAGYKRCLVLSQEKSLIARAIDLGFKETKLTCLAKDF